MAHRLVRHPDDLAMRPGDKLGWLGAVLDAMGAGPDPALRHPAVLHVAVALAAKLHDSKTGACHPLVADIARAAGLGDAATRRALKALEGAGLLGRTRVWWSKAPLRGSYHYQLLVPATAAWAALARPVRAYRSTSPTYKTNKGKPPGPSSTWQRGGGLRPLGGELDGLAARLRPVAQASEREASPSTPPTAALDFERLAQLAARPIAPLELSDYQRPPGGWLAVFEAWADAGEGTEAAAKIEAELEAWMRANPPYGILRQLFPPRLFEAGADPLVSVLPRPAGAPPSLGVAALERIAAASSHAKTWFEEHPPGGLVACYGRRYLVPAYNPAVETERDARALAAIHRRARELHRASPGARLDALRAARRRFPTAADWLMQAEYAHELARAEYIAGRLPAVVILEPTPELIELRRRVEERPSWQLLYKWWMQPNPDRVVRYDASLAYGQVEALEAALLGPELPPVITLDQLA